MVAYLPKSEGTTAGTSANGEVELTAIIDGQVKTITEASLRRHLNLEDNGGVTTLPNSKIFEQLALIGAPETSPSRITSSPSLSPQTHTPVSTPSTLQPPNTQPTPDAEEAIPMPYESPLHSVHSLGRDEDSLSLNELTDLCTSLSNKVWDQIQSFAPMDSEKEKGSEKKGSRNKSLARKRAGEKQCEESTKRQKIEDDVEKEEVKAYLDLVPREEFAMEIDSLATKTDGSSKNDKIFSEMLDDFDKQDVLELHRLVKARYMTSSPEGYELMFWGDLKILFEPDKEDEVWRNQHEYNLIS
ncbi:hypothetical protein Tco_1268241 [Tanacetum coccineum]